MAMTFTVQEIEDAAFLLIADEDGNYRWSSDKTPDEVAEWLQHVAYDVRWQALTPEQQRDELRAMDQHVATSEGI